MFEMFEKAQKDTISFLGGLVAIWVVFWGGISLFIYVLAEYFAYVMGMVIVGNIAIFGYLWWRRRTYW